jgi:hypothetical protein
VLARAGGEVAARPITPRPPFHPVPLAHLACLVTDGPRNTQSRVDDGGEGRAREGSEPVQGPREGRPR